MQAGRALRGSGISTLLLYKGKNRVSERALGLSEITQRGSGQTGMKHES